ncbi:hypothetical protein DFH28DRAFT_926379 [Melampsora americana]|nr:hypothetical protein DFH28DRAFT_926379 [Melampsora americana]
MIGTRLSFLSSLFGLLLNSTMLKARCSLATGCLIQFGLDDYSFFVYLFIFLVDFFGFIAPIQLCSSVTLFNYCPIVFLILSRDPQSIAAHYPPDHGTVDGSVAYKDINDWANRCAMDTQSRLQNCLLTNIKPHAKAVCTPAIPSLQCLTSLVDHMFVLLIDSRTEEQLFDDVSSEFKCCIALLRLHAVIWIPRLDLPTEAKIMAEFCRLKQKGKDKKDETKEKNTIEEETDVGPSSEEGLPGPLEEESGLLEEGLFGPPEEEFGPYSPNIL